MLQQILSINWALVLGVLFGLSEVLAQIPQVKANSVFQAIVQVLSFLKDKIAPAPKA